MDFNKQTNTNRAVEWAYYKKDRTGSFATLLCRAWEVADFENRARLEAAYPLLFGAANAWWINEDPDLYIDKLLQEDRK